MFGIEHKVARTARKAGLVTASAALTCVGAGFLTAAAWIGLSVAYSEVFAFVVIGLVYVGAGLVALGFALARPSYRHGMPRPDATPHDMHGLTPMQLVLVSFLQGMDQGRSAKR